MEMVTWISVTSAMSTGYATRPDLIRIRTRTAIKYRPETQRLDQLLLKTDG